MKQLYFLYIIALFIPNMLFAQSDIDFNEFIREFPPGYYYMLESSVNIRSQPNLQGEVIGRLRLHDRIEILSLAGNQQRINNVRAYWYQIRFNNIVGYIWGGYTAVETLIFDIDSNGQNDFFQYRSFESNPNSHLIRPTMDIFIYINGRRITTENINNIAWDRVSFEQGRNKVIIKLWKFLDYQRSFDEIYEIDSSGVIRFIERNEDFER